jgi:hypothetical protein
MNFEITYWYGPRGEQWNAPDILKNIKDAGMTLALAEEDIESNKARLKDFAEYGLKATVYDFRIGKALEEGADSERLIREFCEDYREYPAFHSIHIIDEPHSSKFKKLAEIVRIIKKVAPDKEAYINLFPNYASPEQLGNETYEEHVNQFVEIVQPPILSYDHYHFLKSNAEPDPEILSSLASEREKLIYLDSLKTCNRGGFFANLEIIRKAALKANIPFMLIVLLVEHGGYRNLTRAEIAYEVWQSMAYGSKRVSYFTYACPYDPSWNFQNACIDNDTKPTQHWYDVQAINHGLIQVGKQLENTVSSGVFHNGKPEPESELTTAFNGFGGINKAEGYLTLGFFENGNLLVANKDYVSAQTVSLVPEKGKKIARFDKETGVWGEAKEGTLTFEISAGDGELLKII